MNSEEIEKYILAGKIARDIKEFLKKYIKKGVPLLEIAEEIESRILKANAKPAFPTNLSINEIAAHYTPDTQDKETAHGLLKIDFGVSVDGFIADTAVSFDLTEDKKFKDMLELNQLVLKKVEETLSPKTKIKEIGHTITKTVENWNKEKNTDYSIIQNLSGHSLGKNQIHAGITIPNHPNNNEQSLENEAFAIEPFLTTGLGIVYDGKPGGIYMLINKAPVRDPKARELLNFIEEEYETRPFCKRWLEKAGFKSLQYTLAYLVQQGIIHSFPILIEKSKSSVSQFEHTFINFENKITRTT